MNFFSAAAGAASTSCSRPGLVHFVDSLLAHFVDSLAPFGGLDSPTTWVRSPPSQNKKTNVGPFHPPPLLTKGAPAIDNKKYYYPWSTLRGGRPPHRICKINARTRTWSSKRELRSLDYHGIWYPKYKRCIQAP
jgi:hypothetical protein